MKYCFKLQAASLESEIPPPLKDIKDRSAYVTAPQPTEYNKYEGP